MQIVMNIFWYIDNIKHPVNLQLIQKQWNETIRVPGLFKFIIFFLLEFLLR